VTASQKVAISLLISVFLFGGIAVLAYTGFFDLVETRFYASSLTKSISRETERDAQLIQEFFSDLRGRFSASLNEPAIRRSFLPNQSAEDIFERTRIYGTLLESLGGLQSVRFVDYNGVRLHFSTYSQDILSQERLYIAYRNYNDDAQNLPFEQVQVSAGDVFKLILDNNTDRIIFSFPFYDSLDAFRGTALFSLSVRAVAEWLISENRIKIGENVSLVAEPPGIVTGSPGTSKDSILARVSSIWADGLLALTPFESDTGITLALISAKTSQGVFYGRLINERIFSFPQAMKVILLVSIFLTVYLAVFLLFNIRQDNMTIVQNRLKSLQVSLIENFYEHKGDMDWEQWAMELEQRREGVRSEVKRGIKFSQGRRSEENIDALVDKSWDELLALIGGRKKAGASLDEAKLQNILNRILQAAPQGSPGFGAEYRVTTSTAQKIADTEVLEELEAVEELAIAEAVEELEALEDIAAIEELPAVETVEKLAAAINGFEEGKAAKTGGTKGTAMQQPAMRFPRKTGLLNIAQEKKYKAAKTSNVKVMPFAVDKIEKLAEVKNEDSGIDDHDFPVMAKEEFDILASKIEFSAETIIGSEGSEAVLATELEIVSPFSSLFSSLKGNELKSHGEENHATRQPGLNDVILEQDGINFINQDAFSANENLEKNLDKDFKKLVDSVLY
jgi:hypothetical protein